MYMTRRQKYSWIFNWNVTFCLCLCLWQRYSFRNDVLVTGKMLLHLDLDQFSFFSVVHFISTMICFEQSEHPVLSCTDYYNDSTIFVYEISFNIKLYVTFKYHKQFTNVILGNRLSTGNWIFIIIIVRSETLIWNCSYCRRYNQKSLIVSHLCDFTAACYVEASHVILYISTQFQCMIRVRKDIPFNTFQEGSNYVDQLNRLHNLWHFMTNLYSFTINISSKFTQLCAFLKNYTVKGSILGKVYVIYFICNGINIAINLYMYNAPCMFNYFLDPYTNEGTCALCHQQIIEQFLNVYLGMFVQKKDRTI